MSTKLRGRLSYANVMSTLALFIALGGSSYAAVRINGADIKNRSIAAKKLKRNSITGREVRESRLQVLRARRADKLGDFTADELRVRCPGDTFPIADVCVERTPHSAGRMAAPCWTVSTWAHLPVLGDGCRRTANSAPHSARSHFLPVAN